jgi:hypothetical protein
MTFLRYILKSRVYAQSFDCFLLVVGLRSSADEGHLVDVGTSPDCTECHVFDQLLAILGEPSQTIGKTGKLLPGKVKADFYASDEVIL